MRGYRFGQIKNQMKVKINITASGYTKTVKMNDGTKLVEKWKRESNGFGQTGDSVNFEESELLEETIEALGDCDFDMSAICDALENENAQVEDYDGPAVTNDGHTLKRGDVFYTVACTSREGKLISIPLKCKFPLDWGHCGSETYIDRAKCQEHCDKHNKADEVSAASAD